MKTDIYKTITDKIVTLLEQGVEEGYRLPWRRIDKFELPRNAASGKSYRGINTLILWCQEIERGYSSGQWATYKQWSELGAQVKKGEKSSPIVFWKNLETDENENKEEKAVEANRRPILVSHANVFNAEQVEGFQKASEEGRSEPLEGFFSNIGADVRHGGDKAYFSPREDYVQMPWFNSFNSPEDYYSVLSHELTHWTGGADRLKREFSKMFGDASYAFEELIAELGSAFLCSELRISEDPRREHAQYLDCWLKVLKEDSRAIFTAASKAQAAADYLLERAELRKAA